MKCLSCDVVLTDTEATRKYDDFEEFIDLCDKCLEGLEIGETDDGENEDGTGCSDFDENDSQA